MQSASIHRPAGHWPKEQSSGALTLDFDARHRRRIRLTADQGEDVLLDLPKAVAMADGDGLQLEDGRWLEVRAAAERIHDGRWVGIEAIPLTRDRRSGRFTRIEPSHRPIPCVAQATSGRPRNSASSLWPSPVKRDPDPAARTTAAAVTSR